MKQHQTNSRLIGVFDSGIGGLTVLKALRERFPAEPFVYLGDTARLPYGTKSGDTIVRYAVQAASLLAKEGIGLLVVACNTASAYALPALAARFPHIPVVGVIQPGAAEASAVSRSGRIAVLCTESTARAGAYQSAIAAIRPDAVVTAIPCPLLVGLAEEGWTTGDVPVAVVAHYVAAAFADPATAPDTLVLGCTHFPLLRAAIEAACPASVTIVDSGVTTAKYVTQLIDSPLPHGKGRKTYGEGISLSGEGVQQTENQPQPTPSPATLSHSAKSSASPMRERNLSGVEDNSIRFLATDGADRFARVAQHFLGHDITANEIELVDLAPG